ncbi:MAG TPA: hypothetical protein VL362_03260 [Patescibacteria group bacterium]|jgi:predicted membrane chloride channel (bestrophin family)|nr:hypothetical protein [Patescibacteria group bacterium]
MPKKTQKKTVTTKRTPAKKTESDSTYFLKLVLVVLLGTFWLKFAEPLHVGGFVLAALPLGLLVGLVIVSRYEHFEEDRKIWYAILLVVTIVSSILPAGIVL